MSSTIPFSLLGSLGRDEQNMHYKLNEIKRQHWISTGKRNGLPVEENEIIEEAIAATNQGVALVSTELPSNFPAHIAGKIFDGLKQAAKKLALQK